MIRIEIRVTHKRGIHLIIVITSIFMETFTYGEHLVCDSWILLIWIHSNMYIDNLIICSVYHIDFPMPQIKQLSLSSTHTER